MLVEVDHGVQFGVISAVFDLYTIPIRARAYNDCVKHMILLKTRSSGGILDPRIERVLGPTDDTWDDGTTILTSMVCKDVCHYLTPKMGSHFGGRNHRWTEDPTGSRRYPRGRNVLVEGGMTGTDVR